MSALFSVRQNSNRIFEKHLRIDSDSIPHPAYLGTKALYRVTHSDTLKPPHGYKPVFINYVGRHGARFQTSEKDLKNLQMILFMAEKNGDLKATGQELESVIKKFSEVQKEHYGDISTEGAEEQRGIGRRMYRHYPNVFRGRGLIVSATQKVRTQQSERAFLKGFGKYSGKIKGQILPDSLDDALRFFSISPGYKKYKKGRFLRVRIDSLNDDPRMVEVRKDIGSEFFKPHFLAGFLSNGLILKDNSKKRIIFRFDDFLDDLYGLYAIQFSIRSEIRRQGLALSDMNIGAFFKKDDLKWLAFEDGAKDYLEKGPGNDTLGIQIRDAAPLLVDFIRSTDQYILNPGSKDADLRFAHAETIAPLATLMGIPGASRTSSSIFNYSEFWKPYRVIPLSANIQWILCFNKKEYLLKVLLNEQPVQLPVSTRCFPYYKWSRVKKYYLDKLLKMNVHLQDNMHQYLLDLK